MLLQHPNSDTQSPHLSTSGEDSLPFESLSLRPPLGLGD